MFKGKEVMMVPYQAEYASHVAKWYYNGEYGRFFRHIMRPLSYPDIVNYPKVMNCMVFMIVHNDIPVGMAIVSDYKPQSRVCKIGIMVDKAYQKKGYAMDATISVTDYVLNVLNMNKIVFATVSGDLRTEELLKKGGLDNEATLKEEVYYNGKYLDEVHYTIFKDKFNSLYQDYWRS